MSSGQWHWHELLTEDLDAAARFYAGLFGWKATDVEFDGRPYKMLFANGAPIGGIAKAEVGEASGWSVFLSTEDVERSRAAILESGGKTLFGPVDVPGVGRMLVCRDPGGAQFTLMQPGGSA